MKGQIMFRKWMKRDKNHTFADVPAPTIPRSTFNRSVNHITAFNSGYLVPVWVDEVLPGDTFKVNLKAFSRLSTPTVPLMDNIYVDYHFFYVPFRLVWDNYKRFLGEKDYGDKKEYVMPIINTGSTGIEFNSLFDYMGVPPKVPNLEINALYFRAYLKIWDDHYRDENLQDKLIIPTGDEDIVLNKDNLALWNLRRRNKRKDYFTAAIPDTQKGTPVDLLSSIDLHSERAQINLVEPHAVLAEKKGNLINAGISIESAHTHDSGQMSYLTMTGHGYNEDLHGRIERIYSDRSTIDAYLGLSGLTITDIRLASTIQQFMERDARLGTRYNEFLQAHYGVSPVDLTLQRTQYLGGGKSFIQFNTVPQTSSTDDKSPQGNLAAFGTQEVDNIGFTSSFDEPGCVMCLASVRVDQKYQYGLPKMFSKRRKYDFYYPEFANLTEQPILQKEIFATGNKEDDEKVFGYQERFGEYRYTQNRVSGELRSSYPQSLDYWHLGQKYDKPPMLNESFIQENPPIDRSLAVQNEPQIISDILIENETTRCMPVYSVPGISKL